MPSAVERTLAYRNDVSSPTKRHWPPMRSLSSIVVVLAAIGIVLSVVVPRGHAAWLRTESGGVDDHHEDGEKVRPIRMRTRTQLVC